jgi:hypothetical protein
MRKARAKRDGEQTTFRGTFERFGIPVERAEADDMLGVVESAPARRVVAERPVNGRTRRPRGCRRDRARS